MLFAKICDPLMISAGEDECIIIEKSVTVKNSYTIKTAWALPEELQGRLIIKDGVNPILPTKETDERQEK